MLLQEMRTRNKNEKGESRQINVTHLIYKIYLKVYVRIKKRNRINRRHSGTVQIRITLTMKKHLHD